MILSYNTDLWEAYDPDGVLSAVDLQEAMKRIYPREDLLQFKHRKKDRIIDLGFYGSEEPSKGKWVVYLVGEPGWNKPLVRQQFKAIESALQATEQLLMSHGTYKTRQGGKQLPMGAPKMFSVMNATKWNEIRAAMLGLCDLQPRWRNRTETGYVSRWDGDWYYHFLDGGWKDIVWVEIKTVNDEQKRRVLAELKKIHAPGHETKYGFKVYGYIKEGQSVDYI